jgi:transcriptional regulator with XRE-family HTH domain
MNDNLLALLLMDTPRTEAARQKTLEEIAERLAKFRKERGITQVEMAKKLKTTQSIYSRYERADVRLYVDTMLRIAQILGVTPNDLFGVTKSNNDALEPVEHAIPKRILRRLRGAENLTRTQQDSLILVIDSIVSAGKKKRPKKSLTESSIAS